jgi:5-methylcytosine-specific restriction endonuclease McrA
MAKSISKKQQLQNKRIKPTQKQKGAISNNVRKVVQERSNGVCERCGSQRATQMAHIIGRKHIEHVTTEKDLLHLCVSCHIWLDQTEEGIKFKRGLIDETLL